MKIIIAGSRTIYDINLLSRVMEYIERKINISTTEVVSRGARGIDKCGEHWARNNMVPVKIFNANWNKYGKKAGFIRNCKMAKYGDILVAIWDLSSRGTKNMIDEMCKQKKPYYVFDSNGRVFFCDSRSE